MARPRRLAVKLNRDHAFEATRVVVKQKKLVYVLTTDKRLRYPKGWSKVAYIGTTGRGAQRIASSVAQRAAEILGLRGVRKFHVRILTCQPRRNVRTWNKLERALLVLFRTKYGAKPRCNVQGKRMKERDEFVYFKKSRIDQILEELR